MASEQRHHEPVEELLAAYALNALGADERAEVERLVEREPSAAALLQELLEPATYLGRAVPEATPPASLRQRVLDAARLTSRPRRRWRMPSAPWAAAAVLMMAVVGLGSYSVVQQGEIDTLRAEVDVMSTEMDVATAQLQEQRDLARWVAQPGATTAAVQPVGTPTAEMSDSMGMLVRRARGGPVLLAMNLPSLDGRAVYQVWLWYDGEPTSVGTFLADDDGYTLVHLDQSADMTGAQWVSVEVAPDGGLVQPVGSPILAGNLR